MGCDAVQKTSLTALARAELSAALVASSGRSAKTVYGGHEHLLRQTVIALRADQTMAEHENPGEATVQVLHGRIVLAAGDDSWSGWTGDLIIVPDAPHSLTAIEDSTLLLTVVKHR
jgi:quercetin dioxygenase-like cupin family protein